MKEFLDPNLFPELTQRLGRAEDSLSKAEVQFKEDLKNDVLLSFVGAQSEAAALYQRILENHGRLTNLLKLTQKYFEEWQQDVKDGKNRAGLLSVPGGVYAGFFSSVGSNTNTDYSQYPHAQEYLTRGKTFTQEYEEANAFFQSDEYLEYMQKFLGPSEYSNYKLLIAGFHDAFLSGFDNKYYLDDYTDALMASALRGIVEGLPDATPEFSSSADMYKYIDQYTELSGTKKFISALKQYLKQASALGKDVEWDSLGKYYQSIMKDPEFQAFAKDIYGDDWYEILTDTNTPAGSILRKMGDISKGIGKVQDAAEALDLVLESTLVLQANYEKQAAYLQTVKEALSAAGLYQGNVKKVVEDSLTAYQNQEKLVMEKAEDFITKKIEKKATGTIVDIFNEALPGLKMADVILNTIDKTWDFAFAKDVSAAKTLGGCLQYDKALSTVYDHYIDMMKAGIATDEDMQKAETIYEILIATKKKEQDAIEQVKSRR